MTIEASAPSLPRAMAAAAEEIDQALGILLPPAEGLTFLRFVGMGEAEGDALAEELRRHMIRPDAEYHHKWRVHDYVVWDNRCTNHAAAGGYPVHERRIHWRATMLE